MKREPRTYRFHEHSHGRGKTARPRTFRTGLEQLEDRKLLSVNDLLISTYDSFYGQTVYRYHDTTWSPASGGVATGGAENAGTAYGLTAGPDGSFYVSNNAGFPGQVLHYDVTGNYVGVVGELDATPISTDSPFFTPAAMTFGPGGLLYVADFASNRIYKLDTASTTDQVVGYKQLAYRPGGFTFATDGSNDLIVGGATNHTVTRYSSIDDSPTVLIDPDDLDVVDDIINPSAILAQPNNDLLIADFSYGGDENDHHRIVKYDHTDGSTSTFITLTEPLGTGDFEGFPAQPISLIYEPGGATFLAGVSADHNLHGAIIRFDTDTAAQVGDPIISGIGSPSGLAFTASLTSSIAGRHIFYNQSAYDGASAAAGLPIDFVSDELARAPDKTAYLPGDPTAVAFNTTNYSRGITGIMIDLSTTGGVHSSITASDFVFKTGGNNTPSSWAAAPTPTSVAVSLGGGLGGTDRVEITWSSTISVKNAWLEVQMLATANTGLADNFGSGRGDIFFWGNKVGDSASGALNATNFITNTTDAAQVFATLTSPGAATITNLRDYNRSKAVDTTDAAIVFASLGNLNRLNVGGGGPFAPQGGTGSGGDAGVASALAATTSTDTTARTATVVVARKLDNSDLNHARIVAYFQHLAEQEARPRRILAEAERIAEALGLDDELLDALVSKLKHQRA